MENWKFYALMSFIVVVGFIIAGVVYESVSKFTPVGNKDCMPKEYYYQAH